VAQVPAAVAEPGAMGLAPMGIGLQRTLLFACALTAHVPLPAVADMLPTGGSLVGAYGNWGQCNNQMVQVAEAGANVLFWFMADLAADVDGRPTVQTRLDLLCVTNVSRTLKARGLATTHLISFGGWCARHPDPKWSGAEWFAVFDAWNPRDASTGAVLFDGFDWDFEGCTKRSRFSVQTLNIMGEMSVAAKAAGYVVSMAPCQSYFDVETPTFNLFLNNTPAAPWHQDFQYHGRNAYAYLFAYFGAETFDLVNMQLYESWSPAHYAITNRSTPVEEYVQTWLEVLFAGWEVDFSSVGGHRKRVSVRPDQLLLGTHVYPPVSRSLATKTLALKPSQFHSVWTHLQAAGKPIPRGVFFWCVACGDSINVTAKLNTFLKTRPPREGRALRMSESWPGVTDGTRANLPSQLSLSIALLLLGAWNS